MRGAWNYGASLQRLKDPSKPLFERDGSFGEAFLRGEETKARWALTDGLHSCHSRLPA